MEILYWPLSYCISVAKLWLAVFGLFGIKKAGSIARRVALSIPIIILPGAAFFVQQANLMTPVTRTVLFGVSIVFSVVAVGLFTTKLRDMLTIVFCYFCLSVTENILAFFLYGIDITQYANWSINYGRNLSIEVLNLALLCALYIILRAVARRREYGMEKMETGNVFPGYMMFVILGLFTIFLVSLPIPLLRIADTSRDARRILATTGISGCVFLVVCIYSLINASKKKQYKLKMERYYLMYEEQKEYYQDLLSKDESLRRFRHDVSSHLQLLQGLLTEGNSLQALSYLDDMNRLLGRTAPEIITGNRVLDIVAAQEFGRAPSVKLKWEGMVPDALSIPDIDLCIIFSNLLKNAIRATQSTGESDTVIVHAKRLGCNMVFSITNPSNQRPRFKNGRPVTTKKNRKNHGFGLANTEEVIHKYYGEIQYVYQNSQFTVNMILPGLMESSAA